MLAVLEPCEVQHFVDQPRQTLCAFLDQLENTASAARAARSHIP